MYGGGLKQIRKLLGLPQLDRAVTLGLNRHAVAKAKVNCARLLDQAIENLYRAQGFLTALSSRIPEPNSLLSHFYFDHTWH